MIHNYQNSSSYWITGASRGIGRAIAIQLAKPGNTLILSARHTTALQESAAELQGRCTVHCVPCDVGNIDALNAAWQTIHSLIGTPNVLINNAGVGRFAPFITLSPEDIQEMLDINLRGVIHCTRLVLPGMAERGHGIIVNINSVAATTVFPSSSVYAATKAGLLAFSRSVRQEVRRFGVKIVDVLPGATETEMWDESSRNTHHERMMQPNDIAHAVVALLTMPERLMPEECVLRPQLGDL